MTGLLDGKLDKVSGEQLQVACIEQPRSWAGLPCPVLSAIMEKFTVIDDYIRFGAVCAPWRSAAFLEENSVTVKKKTQLASFPFLLIPRPDPELLLEPQPVPQKFTLKRKALSLAQCVRLKKKKESEDDPPTVEEAAGRCLYSLARKKVYDLQVRLHHREYCRGSSLGWLVTMKKQEFWTGETMTAVKYHIRLQNPFLPEKHAIDLPSLPLVGVVEQRDADDDISRPFIYLRKAVLSASPDNDGNKNFRVMAIMSQFCRLAYFSPAAEDSFRWTPIGNWNNRSNFDDVIYFNKTRQFYAVHGETGEVIAVDIKEQPAGEGGRAKFTQVTPALENREFFAKRYIVELPSGDLLQVLKEESCEPDLLEIKFEVFKFDPIGKCWVQMHSLDDTILFLGQNSSVSRLASDLPEWKPNSIYFTHNWDYGFLPNVDYHYNPRYMGIYSLQDETIQPFFSKEACAPQAMSPVWIEPTLLR